MIALSPAVRRYVLGAVLAAALAATAWMAYTDDAGTAAAATDPRHAPRRAAAANGTHGTDGTGDNGAAADLEPDAELQLDRLQRRLHPDEEDEHAGEAFPARTWQPPPPPPPKPGTEKPQAPPLPFEYFGQIGIEGKSTVFLTHGERNYPVKTGDVIEGAYRVDEIREDAVVFTYLPLAQQQTLVFGARR
jgi:hypothetical protein